MFTRILGTTLLIGGGIALSSVLKRNSDKMELLHSIERKVNTVILDYLAFHVVSKKDLYELNSLVLTVFRKYPDLRDNMKKVNHIISDYLLFENSDSEVIKVDDGFYSKFNRIYFDYFSGSKLSEHEIKYDLRIYILSLVAGVILILF